jgi:anti-anti-sigma factor
MKCSHEDLQSGIRIVRLSGRMDIEGNEAVSLRLTILTTTGGGSVIVDLSAVDFLASVGIGTLVTAAKAVMAQKGRLFLCGASGDVENTLVRTLIPSIIPTYRDESEAVAAFSAATTG